MSKGSDDDDGWESCNVETNTGVSYPAYYNSAFLAAEGEPVVPVAHALRIVLPNIDVTEQQRLMLKYRHEFPMFVNDLLTAKIRLPGYRIGEHNFGALNDFRAFISRYYEIYDAPVDALSIKAAIKARLDTMTPSQMLPTDDDLLLALETPHEARYLEQNRARFDQELREQVLEQLIQEMK